MPTGRSASYCSCVQSVSYSRSVYLEVHPAALRTAPLNVVADTNCVCAVLELVSHPDPVVVVRRALVPHDRDDVPCALVRGRRPVLPARAAVLLAQARALHRVRPVRVSVLPGLVLPASLGAPVYMYEVASLVSRVEEAPGWSCRSPAVSCT